MTRPASDSERRRIAVVGSGVAGLTAAYVASRPTNHAHVTLFEADDRLGGHADTHDVRLPDGRTIGIDTGFIVHNPRTYPTLLRMFAELGIATRDSEMSMSVRCEETGLEYAGALGPRGLFPTARHLGRPAYLRMLTEIPRFHRRARALLATPEGAPDDRTLREFLDDGRFSPLFRTHFMEALVACVWSCDPTVALDYPARYLFTFLEHHGMLGVFGSPQWRTVTGGSHRYVEAVAAGLDEVLTGTPIARVTETPDGVELTDAAGVVRRFDAVVIAAHPEQALAMLGAPTSAQREVLGALPYSPNTAVLHTDDSLLPRARGARASWNYLRRDPAAGGPLTVSYDLTRLMRLPAPDGVRHLVTLNGEDLIDPTTVIATRHYAHPLYTPSSVAARRRLPDAHTERIAFAGAYDGWGFHEDGARSGLAAAERLGLPWLTALAAPGSQPAPVAAAAPTGRARTDGAATLFAATVRHTRRTPWRRSFTHRTHTWLVDLDRLPRDGRVAGGRLGGRLGRRLIGTIEARDHLGDPGATLRANVTAFLADHGIDLPAAADGGRVLLAANARAWGYCFNPISVWWCYDRERLLGVVVEVHNTYGDRHAYLLHPDAQGRGRVDKAMYVSPFHGVDGWYDVAVPEPLDAAGRPGRLDVAVTLHTPPRASTDATGRAPGRAVDGEVFSASLSGTPSADPAWRAAPAALRGAALIRLHGIALWARRLPIRPRPDHPAQPGVQAPPRFVCDLPGSSPREGTDESTTTTKESAR